jgi:peroxiredoxin
VTVISPGTPAPAFRLMREDGEGFTEGELQTEKTMLLFYYQAPSPGELSGVDLLREGLSAL